jgi:hypothetical protein
MDEVNSNYNYMAQGVYNDSSDVASSEPWLPAPGAQGQYEDGEYEWGNPSADRFQDWAQRTPAGTDPYETAYDMIKEDLRDNVLPRVAQRMVDHFRGSGDDAGSLAEGEDLDVPDLPPDLMAPELNPNLLRGLRVPSAHAAVMAARATARAQYEEEQRVLAEQQRVVAETIIDLYESSSEYLDEQNFDPEVDSRSLAPEGSQDL